MAVTACFMLQNEIICISNNNNNYVHDHACYRIADVIITPSSGVQKSKLSPTDTPNQWRMTITWLPTTSDAGPTSSVTCFYAVDIAG